MRTLILAWSLAAGFLAVQLILTANQLQAKRIAQGTQTHEVAR